MDKFISKVKARLKAFGAKVKSFFREQEAKLEELKDKKTGGPKKVDDTKPKQ